ncbi:MAG: riboflavin synthase [Candidatus Nealsonbacteria bacterium DGGOD1a]|nr:MAG: riboflavin synthase [Candidatus Nealsonbacteria bacterium DGGOD1a]
MFTGIITNLGKIAEITTAKLVVETGADFCAKLEIGASVAINGICLTVTVFDKSSFAVEVMPETVKRTNLQYLRIGGEVNLEMPATGESFLAGHIVQGHIDGIVQLRSITDDGNSRVLKFAVDKTLVKYIVEKGSIAVNGVSLTVIEAGNDYFTVGIIPHTWDATMFHNFKTGDFANIEVDVLAKYIEKLIKK